MCSKKLLAEYDRLYEEADRAFKEHDPCMFIDGRCVKNRTECNEEFKVNGCCGTRSRPCEYLSLSGCTVKALGCKLHLCLKLTGTSKELDDKLHILSKAFCEILPGCYLSKRGNLISDLTESSKGGIEKDGSDKTIIGI